MTRTARATSAVAPAGHVLVSAGFAPAQRAGFYREQLEPQGIDGLHTRSTRAIMRVMNGTGSCYSRLKMFRT